MGQAATHPEVTFHEVTKAKMKNLLCQGCYPGGSTLTDLEKFKSYITGKRIKCKMDHDTYGCKRGDEKRARDVFKYCYWRRTVDLQA